MQVVMNEVRRAETDYLVGNIEDSCDKMRKLVWCFDMGEGDEPSDSKGEWQDNQRWQVEKCFQRLAAGEGRHKDFKCIKKFLMEVAGAS